MNFIIKIINLNNRSASRCFLDFAEALVVAFNDLGHIAVLDSTSYVPKDSRLILFGLADTEPDFEVPKNAIIFNSEQVLTGNHWKNLDRYKENIFWDFSRDQKDWFIKQGIRTVHCPIGYSKKMETVPLIRHQDIDVLFYGWANGRRQKILDELEISGLKVQHLFGIYGTERDMYIARSKIVLNLHFYENAVFEMFRVSHILANGKCVVTENGGFDAELEDFARRSTVYVPKDRIIKTCLKLVNDEELRITAEKRGREEFKKTSLSDSVKKALVES